MVRPKLVHATINPATAAHTRNTTRGDGHEAYHLRGEHGAERWGQSGDGFAFGEDQGDAAEEFEGAEGGEDGWDLEDRDEDAVDEAAYDADDQGDAERNEDG